VTAVKTQREVTFPISQTGHGFTAGQALRYTGSVYATAQANSAANAEVVGVVDRVLNANTFYLRTTGRVTGLSGLTPGSTYFLSPSVAGALTATEPTTTGQVSRAVLVADSASSGYVYNNHGATIGAGGGGGGNMATDALWDVKGDLAVGTGPNTAARHAVGANGTFLKADSAQADGVGWTQIAEADITNLVADLAAKIDKALVTTKGDLIATTAASTPARKAVGTNDQLLVADSAQADGLKWAKIADSMILAGTNLAKLAAVTGTPDGTKFLRDDGSWQLPAGGGGGNVGTDVIWDVKGDLAIGTGADTAARQAVGANNTLLVADSAQANGVKWANVADGMVASGQNLTKLSAVTGTPNGAKFLRDDGSWQGISAYGTTLPGSPVDGQQAVLVDSTTNPTYIWQFRYNAGSSSAYKWEFIGGSPASTVITIGHSTTTVGAWADLSTVGPSFVVPRAGDYFVVLTVSLNDSTVQSSVSAGVGLGAFTATPPVFCSQNISPASSWVSPSAQGAILGVAASQELRMRYVQGVAGTLTAQTRVFTVQPIRIS
jgi:hypothetical protein